MDEESVVDNRSGSVNSEADSLNAVLKLYEWSRMTEHLHSKDDLIPIMVKRFSSQILSQYWFHKQIPLSLFPLNHIQMVSRLSRISLDKYMDQTIPAVLGHKLSLDEEHFYDVIYQHSVAFSMKILENELKEQVQKLFDTYVHRIRDLLRLLQQTEVKAEIPPLMKRLDSTIASVVRESIKLDQRLEEDIRGMQAVVSPELAGMIDNVIRVRIRLDPTL